MENKKLSIQGHRGARGLFPENTIVSFIEAVKYGVNALEMDVVISKDLKVVVSHEPWMNEVFCSQTNGDVVEKNSREKYNLYKMTYDEIKTFNCGLRKNPDFPSQKIMSSHKPLLSEVIDAVEDYTTKNNLPSIIYNIEIKSEVPDYNIFQPEPPQFVRLVKEELQKHNIKSRVILQSFDIEILKEIKKQNSNAFVGLLVENTDDLKTNLAYLDFIPDMYNPEFILVTHELIKDIHELNMQIIPWTVNELSDMKRLINMGVDGIITDYPNLAKDLINL